MHIYSKVDESRKMKTTNNFEPRKYVVYAAILLVEICCMHCRVALVRICLARCTGARKYSLCSKLQVILLFYILFYYIYVCIAKVMYLKK